MNREDDLKYLRSVIDSNHAFGCVESVINRLYKKIDRGQMIISKIIEIELESMSHQLQLKDKLKNFQLSLKEDVE